MLALAEEGRAYVIGRAAECDLPLADADASREHAEFVRRGATVFVRDRKAKNGTWLGEARVPDDHEVPWRPTQMVQLGRTVLALREPINEALARIEGAPDEPLPAGEPVAPPHAVEPARGEEPAPASAAPVVDVPAPLPPAKKPRSGWSGVDLLVMAVALGVLSLSVAGLVWLLRG